MRQKYQLQKLWLFWNKTFVEILLYFEPALFSEYQQIERDEGAQRHENREQHFLALVNTHVLRSKAIEHNVRDQE